MNKNQTLENYNQINDFSLICKPDCLCNEQTRGGPSVAPCGAPSEILYLISEQKQKILLMCSQHWENLQEAVVLKTNQSE